MLSQQLSAEQLFLINQAVVAGSEVAQEAVLLKGAGKALKGVKGDRSSVKNAKKHRGHYSDYQLNINVNMRNSSFSLMVTAYD